MNEMLEMDGNAIAYCVGWEQDKPKTWSGTPWSLKHALSDRVDLLDMPLRINAGLFIRALGKMRRTLGVGDMGMADINRMDHRFRSEYGDKVPEVFIQYGEAPRPLGEERHYVYQDLCVEWLKECCEDNPTMFSRTGFGGHSLSALKRAAASQAQFYRDAAGVFCMGHWFAEYLVRHCDLPAEKVHWVGAGYNVRPDSSDAWRRKGNKLLFVGRDFKRKGGGRPHCRVSEGSGVGAWC